MVNDTDNDLLSEKPAEDLDDLIDSLSTKLDEILGQQFENVLRVELEKIRKVNRDCADEIESELLSLSQKQRFGRGAWAYVRVNVFMKLSAKYRK